MKTIITILLLMFSLNCFSQKIELDTTRAAYVYSKPKVELEAKIICLEMAAIFTYNAFIANNQTQRYSGLSNDYYYSYYIYNM